MQKSVRLVRSLRLVTVPSILASVWLVTAAPWYSGF
jgi:hypothetical protein